MSLDTVITYPIPAYQNLPITPQYYAPRIYQIQDITLGKTTLVETVLNHDYVIGQLCRLHIPPQNGCRQLNGQTGYVVFIPSDNEVILDIYSSGGDPFVSSTTPNIPTIAPVGDINSGAQNSIPTDEQTYIDGSFRNVS